MASFLVKMEEPAVGLALLCHLLAVWQMLTQDADSPTLAALAARQYMHMIYVLLQSFSTAASQPCSAMQRKPMHLLL